MSKDDNKNLNLSKCVQFGILRVWYRGFILEDWLWLQVGSVDHNIRNWEGKALIMQNRRSVQEKANKRKKVRAGTTAKIATAPAPCVDLTEMNLHRNVVVGVDSDTSLASKTINSFWRTSMCPQSSSATTEFSSASENRELSSNGSAHEGWKTLHYHQVCFRSPAESSLYPAPLLDLRDWKPHGSVDLYEEPPFAFLPLVRPLWFACDWGVPWEKWIESAYCIAQMKTWCHRTSLKVESKQRIDCACDIVLVWQWMVPVPRQRSEA